MEDAAGRTAASRPLTVAAAEALTRLEFDWGEAYRIGRDDAGTWWAARRDCGDVLTARSAEELRATVRADYAASPVPRGFCGDAG